jgi:hypothetical protein
MFLFYTLMCRNYQEYKWKPCWSQIGTFQKSVPELFSKMVTLRVEDGVKRKTLQLQSCREFHGEHSGHLNNRENPAPLQPKMRRRESERLYKGRNPSSWGIPPPTNLPPPAPSLLLSTIFTAISITYTMVHHPTHLCTVLCKYGVWCYNIYPMIYVMFA